MKKFFVFILISLFISNNAKAQGLLQGAAVSFAKQDTLRGSITKERLWWDLKQYHLDIKINPSDSTITGSNTIKYKVLQENNRMQIDLQNPMDIYKVIQDGKTLEYTRDGNAFFIELVAPQTVGKTMELTVFYGG
ncbi:MAG: hypothetical protein ACI9WT_001557, partial [Flavobacterium sp.]